MDINAVDPGHRVVQHQARVDLVDAQALRRLRYVWRRMCPVWLGSPFSSRRRCGSCVRAWCAIAMEHPLGVRIEHIAVFERVLDQVHHVLGQRQVERAPRLHARD